MFDGTFTVSMEPRGKTQGGRQWSKAVAAYMAWKRRFVAAAYLALGDQARKLPGPLTLDVVGVFARTADLSKVYKRTGKPKHPTGFLPYTSKPDASNVGKAVEDALGDLGLYEVGDQQVVTIRATTVYSELGGYARVIVRLRQIEPSEVATHPLLGDANPTVGTMELFG